MPEWDAEIEITHALVRALLAKEHTDLTAFDPVLVGEGFDNSAYQVGEWLFRFPRRTFGGEAIEIELAWLPRLAKELPLPISAPTRIGSATEEYPWRFAGYRRLPGETADRASLTEAQRAKLAAPLGTFLRALHAIPVPPEAPVDTLGRHEHTRRAPRVIERLRSITDRELSDRAIDSVERLAETPAWNGERVWVHGDLYGRHLLVDEEAALTAVIDWGDLHAGDRAIDLSIAWSFLPPFARSSFLESYGPVDRDTWARARFRALHYGAALLVYGPNVADTAITALGRLALEEALRESEEPDPLGPLERG